MKQILWISIFVFACVSRLYAQSEFEFTHYNNTTTPVFGGNNFKAVAVGKAGYIWAGSQYHGTVVYIPATNIWDIVAAMADDILVTDMKTDQSGNIWIMNAGRSGLQGGGSNIGGGLTAFSGDVPAVYNFYTITGSGNLTSRNARSIWIDKNRSIKMGKTKAWLAQGTYISSNNTQAGGFSLGLNTAPPYFTKGYKGLQVTPYVSASQARTPSCLAIGGGKDEVLVFAQGNFFTNQLLRYRADEVSDVFLGAYDYTNTPVLTHGFRANAIYFDDLDRGWIGLQEGGVIIKTGTVWKTMNMPSIFPTGTVVNPNAITSDQNGYVYIGTSLGLVIYLGGAVDSESSYRRITTTDGLVTNNINGIAIDTFGHRIVLAHSAGVSFMKFTAKIKATLEWDYSFPLLNTKPKGVVADGVSRLYVKVRTDSSIGKTLKKVALSIKNISSSLGGKLKVATQLHSYSNEANSGTLSEVSRTDSTPSGDFYFWYVAPDDFSKDSLSAEAQLSERTDSIKVKVTYQDDTEDSTYLPVKVMRPPLMIASMVTNTLEKIDALKLPDNMPIIKSDKFLHRVGFMMNSVSDLAKNVSRLIDGDIIQNEDKVNSLQGMLEDVRKTGFAATRVDYVGHGLSGNILRAVAALKSAKFYADGSFAHNNYGQGFVNKFISVNTPHNNTPVFEMISELMNKQNELSMKVLRNMVSAGGGQDEEAMEPYPVLSNDSLLAPIGELLQKAMTGIGSFKLPLTNMKNHLIISNAEATPEKLAGKSFGILGKIGPVLMMALRDNSPTLKDTMTAAFSNIHTMSAKILKALDKYAETKGYPDFSANSDMLVPLSSQAAGQSLTLPNITKFTSDSIENVLHQGILNLKGVGAKIFHLLNTSIQSNAFSNSIPANSTTSFPGNIVQKVIKVLYDTTKIVTDERQLDANRTATANDTTIILNYRVKDTVGLQYIFVTFQDSMYTTTSKAKNQSMMLKVKHVMSYSGLQNITAVGVYESQDSIKYHADTIPSFVSKPDTIQGFRVTTDKVQLFDDITYHPSYEVKVKEKWQTLPPSDSLITWTIENANALSYDSAKRAFHAKGDGFSRTYFNYKTFKDTVTFECLLSLTKSAINLTVASGNFKDSATWSKGRPPLPGDSVIVSAGHSIVLDKTAQIRSLRINGTLTLNNSTMQLQLGDMEDGNFVLDNYGTLNINNGTLTVRGRVKLNAASTFNMTGGMLIVDGNTGYTITSLANGLFLFDAAPAMALFSFTGGTLQIIDPPIGVASQAINCPYNFGENSTLMLGNGISLTASENPGGFGGLFFPPVIGKLILDAGTEGNNRILDITRPLNVKGSLEVKANSKIILKAPVTVSQ